MLKQYYTSMSNMCTWCNVIRRMERSEWEPNQPTLDQHVWYIYFHLFIAYYNFFRFIQNINSTSFFLFAHLFELTWYNVFCAIIKKNWNLIYSYWIFNSNYVYLCEMYRSASKTKSNLPFFLFLSHSFQILNRL